MRLSVVGSRKKANRAGTVFIYATSSEIMNYSDYDSDGYSSNEDADYVPSGERSNLELFQAQQQNPEGPG